MGTLHKKSRNNKFGTNPTSPKSEMTVNNTGASERKLYLNNSTKLMVYPDQYKRGHGRQELGGAEDANRVINITF